MFMKVNTADVDGLGREEGLSSVTVLFDPHNLYVVRIFDEEETAEIISATCYQAHIWVLFLKWPSSKCPVVWLLDAHTKNGVYAYLSDSEQGHGHFTLEDGNV